MGTTIPLSHFTEASRRRLAACILHEVSRKCSEPAQIRAKNVAVGRLIHIESGLLYEQAEMSEPMKLAPWLHVIGKLAEEHPEDFGGSELRNALRGCVEDYIAALQSAQATA